MELKRVVMMGYAVLQYEKQKLLRFSETFFLVGLRIEEEVVVGDERFVRKETKLVCSRFILNRNCY